MGVGVGWEYSFTHLKVHKCSFERGNSCAACSCVRAGPKSRPHQNPHDNPHNKSHIPAAHVPAVHIPAAHVPAAHVPAAHE